LVVQGHATDEKRNEVMAPIPHLLSPPLERDRRQPELVLLDPEPIRVLIADGQPIVRAGFHALLDRERDMIVAAAASTGEEAVALAREFRPDVALLDMNLPGLDGLEATRRILGDPECAGVRVVLLAASDSEEPLFAALREGASGFLVKSTEARELVQAVRVVATGEALLSPGATRRLIAEFASRPQPQRPTPDQLAQLTAREREVMTLVAAGMRNDEIAERFVISPATVKTHVSRALRKLDARDRAQLVAIAYQVGLVHAGACAPLAPLIGSRPTLVAY
jgi:DNA-binding NarL/FixJ family response regulator